MEGIENVSSLDNVYWSPDDNKDPFLQKDLELLKSLSEEGYIHAVRRAAEKIIVRHPDSPISRLYVASLISSLEQNIQCQQEGLSECEYVLIKLNALEQS